MQQMNPQMNQLQQVAMNVAGMGGMMLPPGSKCYKEGCNDMGFAPCHYIYCCKQVGCGKPMCYQHRSQKCYTKGKHEPNPNVCLACEPEVYKKSCLGFFIPCGIFFTIWLTFMFSIIILPEL